MYTMYFVSLWLITIYFHIFFLIISTKGLYITFPMISGFRYYITLYIFQFTYFRYPIVSVILPLLVATLAAIPPSSNFTSMSYRYQLRMGAININSNRSACYDSKVQHADFTDLTRDLDVIGITETHSSMESDVQKQGYKHFAVVRKKATLARAHSGGIAVLVRNSLASHTSMCEWSNPCCLTIRVNGAALDLAHDLYIVTVYVPPENSSYLKSTGTDPFDLLHLTQQRIPPLAHVVWMGDFNAHLDQANSSSPHVSSDLLPALNCDLPSADPPARKSLDTRKVGSYGRKLLQFCGGISRSSMGALRGTLRAILPMRRALSGVSSIMPLYHSPYGP